MSLQPSSSGPPGRGGRLGFPVQFGESVVSRPLGADVVWRKFPRQRPVGWNQKTAGPVVVPPSSFFGCPDSTISPTNVAHLLDDLGTSDEVLLTLPRTSHLMIWESQHDVRHRLSPAWLVNDSLPPA